MDAIYDPTRTVHIPLSGYVDITGMEAIVNHPLFARLRFRRQLGFTCMVKPGGMHSRFEHSVGTMHTARAMLRRFRVDPESELHRAVETYALLHDLGHGPTSHELEYVLHDDHELIGQQRVREMRAAVDTYAPTDLVLALMEGKHDWSILIKHKTFGADKLDYLERDAHHIGYDIALNKGRLINCLQFKDGQFGIDEDAKDEVITNQFNYLRMYLEVYLHRSVQMFARMYQRALKEAVEQKIVSPEIVWDLVDHELHAQLMYHPLMRWIIDRQPLRTVVCFKIAGYESEEKHEAQSAYPIIGIDRGVMEQWSTQLHRSSRILALERELETEAVCPDRSVFIVQTDPLPRLLRHPDIQIYSRATGTFRSLYETKSSPLDEIVQRISRAYYLCVMTTPEAGAAVAKLDLKGFFIERLSPVKTH